MFKCPSFQPYLWYRNGGFKNVKVLPYDLIKQDNGGEYVYLLKDSKAKKVYIQTGIEFENFVEIVTPFKDTDVFLSNDSISPKNIIIVS